MVAGDPLKHNGDASSTLVAREQFLSWAMISVREPDWPRATNGIRYSFFQARNAIYHSLKLLGIQAGSRILVPSYVCRAAIEPLIAYGMDVDFYAVKLNCVVDLLDLERRITPSTCAVMIVHYFGFPQPASELRRLCDRHRLILIEDCAHVLSGEIDGLPLGSFGNAAVFSWRKFLPIYDGAELIIKRAETRARIPWAREDGLFTLKLTVNMLETSLGAARRPLLRVIHQGIRGGGVVFRKLANRYLRKSSMMQADTSNAVFDIQNVNWPMSRLSRWTKVHSNIKRIIEKRRRNYEMLMDKLAASSSIKPLFSVLPPGVCPWVCPVFFAGLTEAHTLLRRKGIPAVTWGGVRHPLTPADTNSDFLYERLVFLPVHQCLQDRDMINVARTATAIASAGEYPCEDSCVLSY